MAADGDTGGQRTGSADRRGAVPIQRVRKAYEQVADQLRELILAGELAPAQRLPSEAALSAQFGVSRATTREALRALAAENLIRTTRGATGGSFVTLPTAGHISDFLSANINLLSQAQDISLDEFLELRDLLEVPAVSLAAERRGATGLEELRAAIPDEPMRLTTQEQFVFNRGFHSALVAASGNTLLSIAAQPIFTVLQTNLSRSTLGRRFHETINHDHREILRAVEDGDGDGAAELMRGHLEFLRPMYERAWRYRHRRDG